jgi:endonuclease YncB( thermonuclease family)
MGNICGSCARVGNYAVSDLPTASHSEALMMISPDVKHIDVNLLYLNNILYNDTVPFVPPIQFGKVIKVYDGDTITIASLLPNTIEPVFRFSVRLNGINSIEKADGTKNKILESDAKEALHNLVYGKIVYLKKTKTEKFARILADVYCDGVHVNQWLLDNQYAVPFKPVGK